MSNRFLHPQKGAKPKIARTPTDLQVSSGSPKDLHTLPSMIDKNWYNEFYRRQPAHAVPPQIVQRYKELRHPQLFFLERWFEILGNVEGKRILYLACGHDNSGILLAMKGAAVWVLDIALEAVRIQVQICNCKRGLWIVFTP